VGSGVLLVVLKKGDSLVWNIERMPDEAEAMFVYLAERHYQRALQTLDVSSENWCASIYDGTHKFQDNDSWA